MNQIVLVGQVKENPEIHEASNGSKYTTLVMEVDKPYKNNAGSFDKDLFQVTMWRNLAEECEKTIKEGMSIGVKGRLSSNNYLNSEDKVRYRADIVAERISVYEA